MEFRVLGPLEVRVDGDAVPLGGRRPRALLAVLLLHPNEVVPADRLIEELWGEDSPERAAAALRVNVSRLRKALPPDVLATRSPGYVLRVAPDELDLHRFERLVDEGRSLLAARPRGRCGGAAPRCALAVAGPGARRRRLRELRPGGNRAARGDQADGGRAPGGRGPRARAPRRGHRRARDARRRAPAPRASAEVPDDGAVPVGPAGGGPGRVPGRASRVRRRARHRAEPGAPGAGAGDPPAGPVPRRCRAGA